MSNCKIPILKKLKGTASNLFLYNSKIRKDIRWKWCPFEYYNQTEGSAKCTFPFLYIKEGNCCDISICYGTKIHPSFWSLCRASNSLEISHSSVYIKMKQVLKHNDCEIIWNSGFVLPPASISYLFSLGHTQVNYSNIKHMCCCRYALHICSGPSIDILNTENNNNDTLTLILG